MFADNLKDKRVPWYNEKPESLPESGCKLLLDYSGVPADKVWDHVMSIRETAWEVFPFPCVGEFSFLNLSLEDKMEYPEILQRLKNGEKFLDLGCCFGQEIRKLVADGVPSDNLYGCDLEPKYFDIGYDLFLDRNTLKAKFSAADVFDETSLQDLKGQFDIIYAGAFFHLFGLNDQIKVAHAVASLLKPQKGSIMLARQIGSLKAHEWPHPTNPKQVMYKHDAESLNDLWEDVGKTTGASYELNATFTELPPTQLKFHNDSSRRIDYAVRRN